MALPEQTQKLVELKLGAFCTDRIPAHVRHLLRMSFSLRGNTATVFEERVVHDQRDRWTKMPMAQFRLDVIDGLWRLYCANSKREDGWLLFPDVEPTQNLEALISALDRDKSGAFWG